MQKKISLARQTILRNSLEKNLERQGKRINVDEQIFNKS